MWICGLLVLEVFDLPLDVSEVLLVAQRDVHLEQIVVLFRPVIVGPIEEVHVPVVVRQVEVGFLAVLGLSILAKVEPGVSFEAVPEDGFPKRLRVGLHERVKQVDLVFVCLALY